MYFRQLLNGRQSRRQVLRNLGLLAGASLAFGGGTLAVGEAMAATVGR